MEVAQWCPIVITVKGTEEKIIFVQRIEWWRIKFVNKGLVWILIVSYIGGFKRSD